VSEHQEQTDEVVPKKRGRKKRSTVEAVGGEFGSRWGVVVGTISTEWSAVAQPETSSAARRRTSPQKESFRQYRVMHDSDVEGAAKSDNYRQMASLSSSSDSSDSSDDDGNSSTHSDDDDADDVSTSSSSPDNSPPASNSGNQLVFLQMSCLSYGEAIHLSVMH